MIIERTAQQAAEAINSDPKGAKVLDGVRIVRAYVCGSNLGIVYTMKGKNCSTLVPRSVYAALQDRVPVRGGHRSFTRPVMVAKETVKHLASNAKPVEQANTEPQPESEIAAPARAARVARRSYSFCGDDDDLIFGVPCDSAWAQPR